MVWPRKAGQLKTRGLQVINPLKIFLISNWLKELSFSQAHWLTPVIPAPQEAEAGASLEVRRLRLPCAEIAPLHYSLGNKRETPSQKKKNNKFRFRGVCVCVPGCIFLVSPVQKVWKQF